MRVALMELFRKHFATALNQRCAESVGQAENPVLIPRVLTFEVNLLFSYENEAPWEFIVSSWLPPEDWEEFKNLRVDSQW